MEDFEQLGQGIGFAQVAGKALFDRVGGQIFAAVAGGEDNGHGRIDDPQPLECL